eukprot:4865045-Pyramimonas_sp.AAC.1
MQVCLTKHVPTDFLVKILRTGAYGVTLDPGPTLKKVKTQLARARVNAIPSGKYVTESWLPWLE